MDEEVSRYDRPCPRCGHRALLHGFRGGREYWCIAYDVERDRYCGCTLAPEYEDPS